jgi:hypothetical protein
MAKIAPLTDVGSLANTTAARAVINDNSQKIEDAFTNTLSRDGSAPNEMGADIDLNDHFLLNVADPVNEADGVNLRSVRPLVEQFASQIVESAVFGTQIVDTFAAATAGQTVFPLSATPGRLENVEFFVDGVALRPGLDFTLSGPDLKTLTLVTPLAGGELTFARYSQALPSSITSSDSVVYTPPSTGIAGTVKSFLDALWNPVAGSTLVRFIASGVGAFARTIQDKARENGSVLDYIDPSLHAGILAGSETAPLQTYFNAAFTAHDVVNVPAGTYYLTDMVTIPLGKKLKGAGRRKTIIKVPATFNLAALGVLRLAAGQPGGEIEGITIEFAQPDSATVGVYTQYPPAVYAQGTPRFRIYNCRFALCWNGIDMKGNSGGAVIDDLELSMFNIGIDIQGSLDTVRISKLHLWPFGVGSATFTANQRTVWKDAYGIRSEKCDGLKISDSLFYEVRKALYLYKGVGAADVTLAEISNPAFDGDGGMHVIQDARVSIATGYWTKGATDGSWLTMTGGQVRIASSRLSATAAAIVGNGLIDISAGNLWLTGCALERGAQDHRFIYASGTAVVNIVGCTAFSNAGTTFANPAIEYAGTSVGAITGLFAPAKGGGTGRLVTIASDNGFTMTNCTADGWTVQPPTTRLKTIITHNVGPEQDQFAGCVDSAGVSAGLPPGWSCATLGTGNYTITHNLGLNAVRDMIFIPTGEASDAVAVWSVSESTTATARIRTTVAGAAANTGFSFITRRRR